MSKKPRFFCDNCGHEVERDARSCAHCGRFFSSVRCPSCGYTSSEKAFSNGCPSCGYSAPPDNTAAGVLRSKTPQVENRHEGRFSTPLPLWVYIVSICAFIVVCAILASKLLG